MELGHFLVAARIDKKILLVDFLVIFTMGYKIYSSHNSDKAGCISPSDRQVPYANKSGLKLKAQTSEDLGGPHKRTSL